MSEEKKPHPFSKEAKEARAKEKEIQSVVEEKDLYEVDKDKKYKFKLCNYKKGNYFLTPRSICRDLNMDGEEVSIRYIKGKSSLYEEEQGEIRQGELTPLVFFDGELEVDGAEERLVRFLLMSDYYEGNPNRISAKPPIYKLENREQIEEKINNRFAYEMKAMNLVASKPVEELRPLAIILLGLKDDAHELAVRNGLLSKAKENPDFIVKQLANPEVARQYILEKALEKDVIAFGVIPESYTWSMSTKIILTAKKKDKTPIQQLVDFSFTEEGEQVFKDIEAAASK